MKNYFIISMLFFSVGLVAQIGRNNDFLTNGRQLNDTINGGKFQEESTIELEEKTYYTDYKIVTHARDSIVIDTTLSLQKERLFNHLRRDNFELLSLHNQGQTYNRLAYNFNKVNLLPKIGMRAKKFDYMEIEDVKYYHVPTPTSELFFKTGIQQGQVLNSVITANISPEINLSITYKGLRSLGDYRNARASRRIFGLTHSFVSKNKKYKARWHFVAHNLMNQENGGLTPASVSFFTTQNQEYQDRERLDVNFIDAESRLKTKRLYLNHSYNIWENKDTTKKSVSRIKLGHEIKRTNKLYAFNQEEAHTIFGNAYQNKIADSTYSKTMDNSLFISIESPLVLGSLELKTTFSNYYYGYKNILYLDNQTIPEKIEDNVVAIATDWNADFKLFSLQSSAGTLVKGALIKGNFIKGVATYQQDSLFSAKATVLLKSSTPNLNFLLYQSDYINYNWYNSFENENTRYFGFSVVSKKLFDTQISLTQKTAFTYFDKTAKPQQYDGLVNYLKLKAHRSICYKKFTLDNTFMYQKVTTGSDVFRVPKFITENSLYFTDYIFKGDPLYLQTGITFKYFTRYNADEFNPLLNEFVLQNQVLIGNYPRFDFFVNGQVSRARLFLKAENFSSLFLKHNYFATPTQPYRDFTLRFGVVWNFFI